MSDPTSRPFRFGVQLSSAEDGATWTECVRKIEDLGYSTVTVPDHFADQLAPVPAIMAAAAVTSTLRVGALVFDNDFKHPLVLAKELATIDVLSGGRVEIGLGAGWLTSDYRESGLPFDPPKVRIDRMAEGLTVIKRAHADGLFSFRGEHYTITEHQGWPRPVQRPHPPILVGGGGRRVLGLAAREADIVGINGMLRSGVVGPEALSSMTLEAVRERLGWVREAAGERFGDLELNIRVFYVSVTDDAAGALGAVAGMVGVEPAMVDASPFALVGSVERIVELVQQRREELGFSYVIVGPDDVDAFAPVVARLAGT